MDDLEGEYDATERWADAYACHAREWDTTTDCKRSCQAMDDRIESDRAHHTIMEPSCQEIEFLEYSYGFGK